MELELLDDEFDALETSSKTSSTAAGGDATGGLHEEDDDILIQKLEQESQYLTKLLFSNEEEMTKVQEEVKRTSTSNQMLEIENANLEKKVKAIVPLDSELVRLQKDLSEHLDEEKRLFD